MIVDPGPVRRVVAAGDADREQDRISAPVERFALIDLVDGWAVFDRWAGDIHVASPLAGAVLVHLGDGLARSEAELVAWIETEFELDDPTALLANVGGAVAELLEAGLVRRLSR